MIKAIMTTALMVFGVVLISGCATLSIQKWPDDEKNVEAMIVTISQQVGEGLRTGAFTINQSQMFLRQLGGMRRESAELSSKNVMHAHWNDLHKRLDSVEEAVNNAFAQSGKVDEDSRSAVRVVKLQQDLDNAIKEERLSQAESTNFQSRLDEARKEYIKITVDDGTPITLDEKRRLSSKLDSITTDLNKFQ
jgi:hypothetical protein